jgi:hypothetical protein
MSTKILNTQVEMDPSGRVTISSEEFLSQALRPVMERFDKKVSGRMFLSKDRGELVFDPYNTGQNASTVRQKEVVGQVVVTRSLKQMKFSLSLPVSMSQSLMSLTLMEQASLVAEALRSGLYERMTQDAAGGEQETQLAA